MTEAKAVVHVDETDTTESAAGLLARGCRTTSGEAAFGSKDVEFAGQYRAPVHRWRVEPVERRIR